MYQNFIGVDISKDTFAVALYGQKATMTFPQTQAGFTQFYRTYKKHIACSLIVLETTGGYEMSLIRYLQARECHIHRANASKVKHFIRSFGILGKSDSIDALALAQYAHDRHTKLELFVENPANKLLKLVQRRNDLKQILVQEKNRLKAPEQYDLKKSIEAVIVVIKKQMEKIETLIEEACKQNPELEKKKAVLKTVHGIGDLTAVQLLALLPELGRVNRKQIASLGGVAPHPNESGLKIGYRFTRGGRIDVKPVLFMAAMAAARGRSELAAFYQKLIASGKKKMVALTALMRKILVIANARLRELFTNLKPQTT